MTAKRPGPMKRRSWLTPEQIEAFKDRASEAAWREHCRKEARSIYEKEDEEAYQLLEYRERRGDFEREGDDD